MKKKVNTKKENKKISKIKAIKRNSPKKSNRDIDFITGLAQIDRIVAIQQQHLTLISRDLREMFSYLELPWYKRIFISFKRIEKENAKQESKTLPSN